MASFIISFLIRAVILTSNPVLGAEVATKIQSGMVAVNRPMTSFSHSPSGLPS